MLQPLDSNFTLNENNIPMKLIPVAFASKTLTNAELNYANIECELLGVVFGVLHFKHFTFGNEVNIITDTDNTSMQSIQKETQNDVELQTLLQYIMKGFPMTKDECHYAVQPYFNYREELTVVNGLVLKGQRIVIPNKLRQSCLVRLTLLIWGLTKLYRARQSVFWPGLTKDINEIILACPACMKYAAKNCLTFNQ